MSVHMSGSSCQLSLPLLRNTEHAKIPSIHTTRQKWKFVVEFLIHIHRVVEVGRNHGDHHGQIEGHIQQMKARARARALHILTARVCCWEQGKHTKPTPHYTWRCATSRIDRKVKFWVSMSCSDNRLSTCPQHRCIEKESLAGW